MATTIEINKKYHEKMPLEKKTAFLFEYRNKSYTDKLDDKYHVLKRNIGFAWFDRMLEDCRNEKCPGYFSDDIFYALTDISLEGYVLQKAYYFSGAEVGISDKERYFKALGRIDNILVCKKKTKLNINLFNHDSRQIYYKTEKKSPFYQSARLRKAYWSYLKNYPNNDQIEDYFSTCGFIDKIHRIYNKKKCTSEDLEKYKEILSENHHIANPLDLYRFCVVRKKQV
ncbi:MAG TPA: hypothetical protein DCY53_04170 [Desulfobacteraceae bacterium]|nr:hypothetical protein [Desulfobacteraceae bacterium]